ncbi:MAG: tRNA (adenosine(37)-N6)-threonylcarbamoyltransferase complex transferase subunit TsaD [Planctomycetaceae bacterium]|nr:tRNA (adenosine(37)-N6)-threonylcarbamoyltransferase complex transferase subunit TsaD [Planctomycetaceae bacterium]
MGVKHLLAIESSCDETAAAVIDQDRHVLSNVVASQDDLHQRFGGVVPEIASRAHVRAILPVIDEALRRADRKLSDLHAVAVTTEPGLVGSLLVGLTAAKTLAMALGVPLVAVNHVHAHLYACRLSAGVEVFPAVGLVVSGGHTNLYDCRTLVDYELIGSTRDDAAGEAFDKAAAILGLPYPGGPSVERAARNGRPGAFKFPRALLEPGSLDFSFSGLKTALLYEAQGKPGASAVAPELTEQRRGDLAAAFQEAVVDVLVEKCRRALVQGSRERLLVGGGVAANQRLRDRLEESLRSVRAKVHFAAREFCTDNAGMAALAWEALEQGQTVPLDIDVTPGLIRRP